MFSTSTVKPPATLTRNYANVHANDLSSIIRVENAGSLSFVTGVGYGYDAASTTSSFVTTFGGMSDLQVVVTMNYSAPTTAGNEDIGVLLRLQTLHTPDDTYYSFRVDGGVAKITRVLDGAVTDLTTSAFSLSAGDPLTITCSAVGNVLTANFDDGISNVDLNTTDSNIPSGGLVGFKSINSTIIVENFTATEL